MPPSFAEVLYTVIQHAWLPLSRGAADISNCLRPSRHRALNRSPRILFGYPGRLRGSLLTTLGLPWTPFWFPWIPFGSPLSLGPLLGFPGPLLGSLEHLLDSPWTPLGSRSKKEIESDMEDLRFGVQVGTQNGHFSTKKSGNKHDKMGSQTGSGKRVLS